MTKALLKPSLYRPYASNLIAAKLTLGSLLLALPALTLAEPIALRCSYVTASFNASYMDKAESRSCPKDRCYYDLRFDTSTGSASINGVEGYALTVTDKDYQLDRQKRNIVVGGIDRDHFVVNQTDLSYSSIKSTPPGVTLTTNGQCQPLP